VRARPEHAVGVDLRAAGRRREGVHPGTAGVALALADRPPRERDRQRQGDDDVLVVRLDVERREVVRRLDAVDEVLDPPQPGPLLGAPSSSAFAQTRQVLAPTGCPCGTGGASPEPSQRRQSSPRSSKTRATRSALTFSGISISSSPAWTAIAATSCRGTDVL